MSEEAEVENGARPPSLFAVTVAKTKTLYVLARTEAEAAEAAEVRFDDDDQEGDLKIAAVARVERAADLPEGTGDSLPWLGASIDEGDPGTIAGDEWGLETWCTDGPTRWRAAIKQEAAAWAAEDAAALDFAGRDEKDA